jgi:hypothetical protein
MPRGTVGLWLAALVFAFGALSPAASAPADRSQDLSAQSRPHIVIHPRHFEPAPNAKRHCVSWLQKQYRVSGTVIVPRIRCWWD